jgi:hypothetical protein
MGLKDYRACCCFAAIFFAASLTWAGDASGFKFHPDTLAFANSTVFAYQEGKIVSHSNPGQKEKAKRYTRRCFVMSRTVVQFYKFAGFDPHAPPLDDDRGIRPCHQNNASFFPATAICAR